MVPRNSLRCRTAQGTGGVIGEGIAFMLWSPLLPPGPSPNPSTLAPCPRPQPYPHVYAYPCDCPYTPHASPYPTLTLTLTLYRRPHLHPSLPPHFRFPLPFPLRGVRLMGDACTILFDNLDLEHSLHGGDCHDGAGVARRGRFRSGGRGKRAIFRALTPHLPSGETHFVVGDFCFASCETLIGDFSIL